MVRSDFLSRKEGNKSGPHGVIPISFNSHSFLTEHYNTLSNSLLETCHIVIRFQTEKAETQMPNVHGT